MLYEALGIEYRCVDVDGRAETLSLDLNFDEFPGAHQAAYSLVTNFGTSEHVFNQANIFRMMHDLARPGGIMIHGVPFMGYVEHGFFSYHPNFFQCLARYNDYEIKGSGALAHKLIRCDRNPVPAASRNFCCLTFLADKVG